MRKVGAIFCVFIGSLILIIAITGILDPEGAQMANDNDPFGEPPEINDFLVIFGLALVFFLLAAYLFRTHQTTKKDTESS